MFCEAYQRKLKDAAAGGDELSGQLLQHVRGCGDCAAEWTQEQALFAAMDLGLREAVNAELPASLVAGVRKRLTASEPRTIWWKPLLAFAAALLVVGGIAVRTALREPDTNRTENRITVATAPAHSTEEGSVATSASPTETAPDRGVHQLRGERSEFAENRQDAASAILTSPAEAAGLDQYIQRLRKRTMEVTAREGVKDDGPIGFQGMEIAEIDLGVMTIQPLDGAK